MRKFVFVSSFAIAASATTSTAVAEIWPPTHFRCAADQLFGHPSEGDTAEGRTGFGRTQWARTAYNYWIAPNTPAAIQHARRFWQSSFNADVADAADLADTDLYPVYRDSAFNLWVGPGPNNTTGWFGATRTAIRTRPYTGAHDLPGDVAVDALCEAGCYSPEQQIRVAEGFVSVSDAHASGQSTLTTLAPDSTIDSVKLMGNSIARWTVDIAPAQQTIITLRMKSGGQLRVTTEHPLVTSEGVMKQAQSLIVGESLVRDNGAPDPVVKIEKTTEFTKVYNLRPTTTDLTSNILVAQGYLSGSSRYQSEYLKYLNRVLFRNNIPSSVIIRSTPSEQVTAVR
jgi:hypothetical protein